ncbi:MAG: hypothetical protein M4D80_14980 [Myxococcota bacterium]|nr:hypothetical protein [Myxococcota bacterium]
MKSLLELVKQFRGAFEKNASYVEPFYALTAASKHATFAEREAAILGLLDPKGIEHHAEISGLMCVASGALVEDGASTLLGLDTILDRMADGAEILANAGPALEDADLDAQNIAPPTALAEVERRWVAGWKSHVRGAMARLARDPRARKRLRAHPRFEPAVRKLVERTWANHLRYIVDVLDMLDDEPVHVIDLCAGGTLTRYRAFGIRNGFHLMTILDGHDPAELVAQEADFVTAKYGYYSWPALARTAAGNFEAVGLGCLLWGEPRANDLPQFEGVRTVIRTAPSMTRSWDVNFVVPIHEALREQLVVESQLSIEESRPILERMVAALAKVDD